MIEFRSSQFGPIKRNLLYIIIWNTFKKKVFCSGLPYVFSAIFKCVSVCTVNPFVFHGVLLLKYTHQL